MATNLTSSFYVVGMAHKGQGLILRQFCLLRTSERDVLTGIRTADGPIVTLGQTILMLALFLTSAAFGQTTKTDIAIHCVSLPEDVVGAQLCTALREAVAEVPDTRRLLAIDKDGRLGLPRWGSMITRAPQPL